MKETLLHLWPKFGVIGLQVRTTIWAWWTTRAKHCTACKDLERICFAFIFAYRCGQQKPEDPHIEPHGWWHHFTGWYSMSGSLVYLWYHMCGVTQASEFCTHFYSEYLQIYNGQTGNLKIFVQNIFLTMYQLTDLIFLAMEQNPNYFCQAAGLAKALATAQCWLVPLNITWFPGILCSHFYVWPVKYSKMPVIAYYSSW